MSYVDYCINRCNRDHPELDPTLVLTAFVGALQFVPLEKRKLANETLFGYLNSFSLHQICLNMAWCGTINLESALVFLSVAAAAKIHASTSIDTDTKRLLRAAAIAIPRCHITLVSRWATLDKINSQPLTKEMGIDLQNSLIPLMPSDVLEQYLSIVLPA